MYFKIKNEHCQSYMHVCVCVKPCHNHVTDLKRIVSTNITSYFNWFKTSNSNCLFCHDTTTTKPDKYLRQVCKDGCSHTKHLWDRMCRGILCENVNKWSNQFFWYTHTDTPIKFCSRPFLTFSQNTVCRIQRHIFLKFIFLKWTKRNLLCANKHARHQENEMLTMTWTHDNCRCVSTGLTRNTQKDQSVRSIWNTRKTWNTPNTRTILNTTNPFFFKKMNHVPVSWCERCVFMKNEKFDDPLNVSIESNIEDRIIRVATTIGSEIVRNWTIHTLNVLKRDNRRIVILGHDLSLSFLNTKLNLTLTFTTGIRNTTLHRKIFSFKKNQKKLVTCFDSIVTKMCKHECECYSIETQPFLSFFANLQEWLDRTCNENNQKWEMSSIVSCVSFFPITLKRTDKCPNRRNSDVHTSLDVSESFVKSISNIENEQTNIRITSIRTWKLVSKCHNHFVKFI